MNREQYRNVQPERMATNNHGCTESCACVSCGFGRRAFCVGERALHLFLILSLSSVLILGSLGTTLRLWLCLLGSDPVSSGVTLALGLWP